jgi:alpha-beta hydrolase superfamily lysophospholipase
VFNENKTIVMRDGVKIRCQIHEGGHSVWIIGTHGMGDHLGRHGYLQKLFSSDFNILQYDLRGHGLSSGERAYIERFENYSEDLGQILDYLKRDYRMDRFILIGHSMGALITADFIQNRVRDELYPEKIILSSPLMGLKGPFGKVFRYMPLKVLEKLSSSEKGIYITRPYSGATLSHDPRVYEDLMSDPLVVKKIHTKLLFEILEASRKIFSRPLRPKCPSFAIIGSDEIIVDTKDFFYYFEMVEKAFQVKVIEGGAHELHHEIVRFSGPYLDYLKNVCLDSLYNL